MRSNSIPAKRLTTPALHDVREVLQQDSQSDINSIKLAVLSHILRLVVVTNLLQSTGYPLDTMKKVAFLSQSLKLR